MRQADEIVVLAGGLGTRLRSVVSDTPKPLAQVAGRPFLAWVLDALARQDIRRVILATGYLAEQVEAAVGPQWRGMEVVYSVETSPLGTGGALCQALGELQGDAVHVCNGDTFLDYSLSSLEASAARHDAVAAMALAQVPDVARYGVVHQQDGRIQAFAEKGGSGPGLINAGSYFLSRQALDALRAIAQPGTAFSLETDFLHPLAASGRLACLVDTAGFIDIGVPEDYARAQEIFSA